MWTDQAQFVVFYRDELLLLSDYTNIPKNVTNQAELWIFLMDSMQEP